jgi:ankyrin repeat protein
VEELAEVLAVEYCDEHGMPKLNPNWRWEEQEQALLASCSSLIAIVKTEKSRVVQFSHFSVKEYLTSDRLATSRFHILLEPAHTILAQACMSVLVRPDDRVKQSGVGIDSPLARYAAEHWVTHAQGGNVSSCLRKAMECLFDPDKPYFSAWLQLHNVDISAPSGTTFFLFASTTTFGSSLYYAALCGFRDLVEHLIANNPSHDVNARGGCYWTPLVAALAGKHFQTAKILRDNGAHPNLSGFYGRTPLHSAAYYGEVEMVRVLLEYKADVKAQTGDGGTPLHFASKGCLEGLDISPSLSNIVRLLLHHGADINSQGRAYSSPLHEAARYGRAEVVRVLLEHVANLGAEDDDRKPGFQVMSEYVNARNSEGKTPLHYASEGPYAGGPYTGLSLSNVARILLEYGADVNARGKGKPPPLHVAARHGRVEVVRVLLENGANVGAEDSKGRTALQVASNDEIMKLLSGYRFM